jgi:cystathionine beta-lyase
MPSSKNDKNKRSEKLDTALVHLGRDPSAYHGVVNPPVTKTSTILFKDYAAYQARAQSTTSYRYGRLGTPMSDAFESAITELEYGFKSVTYPSGIAAVTGAIFSVVRAGDHILVADSVYYPTRIFCDRDLKRFGVEIEYYDPYIDDGIEDLIRNNTVLIIMESPGSGTYEIQDVPAITKVAQAHDVLTLIDNTWSTPLHFNPIKHGVNIVVHSATKYIVGHSDVTMGVVVCDSPSTYKSVKYQAVNLGYCCSGDDLYLALRSLRTMRLRIEHSAKSALRIAQFLEDRSDVMRVYHPALPSHERHDIWKRDYKGSNGLLSFVLNTEDEKLVAVFVDALKYFPIGSSWGGYESLLQPQELDSHRTAKPYQEVGTLLRLQVGLEDVGDLVGDLTQAFDCFNAALKS